VLLKYGEESDIFESYFWDQQQATKKRKLLLHQVASRGHLRIARMWIEKAATRGQDVKAMVNAEDSRSWQPLHCAAHGGKNEMIEFLLSHGAEINARTNKQQG